MRAQRQLPSRQRVDWLRRTGSLIVCVALIALSGGGSHGQTPNRLNYFKNFFVTGNYATASVDFGSQSGGNGLVTGTITTGQMIPNDADVWVRSVLANNRWSGNARGATACR